MTGIMFAAHAPAVGGSARKVSPSYCQNLLVLRIAHSFASEVKKCEFGPISPVPVKRQTGSVPGAALPSDQARKWKPVRTQAPTPPASMNAASSADAVRK